MEATSAPGGPWTVSRLLTWTRGYLQRQQVDAPRLCAELLLAHAMQCERIHLYTRFDTVPEEDVLARFRGAVREAGAGRPIAHLTGRKEFFSLSFTVGPDVLIPRPETEILVERTIDLSRRAEGQVRRVLDLGTGSGCIAIALARHLPEATVCASDVSKAALAVARDNADRHQLAERIEFAAGDLFAPWQDDNGPRIFDVIVCNPPYIATTPDTPVDEAVRRYEPAVALFAGKDGLDVIRRLVAAAPAHLAPEGHLLLEIAFDQAERVRELLSAGDWQDVTAYRDGLGHERVVHARRRRAENTQVA
ncbi:MAG: peptide chain release factor N(5)-glutamine methyltransferase [Phycisphaerae bacterium]|jgi:release factor glutamine methyltransferase